MSRHFRKNNLARELNCMTETDTFELIRMLSELPGPTGDEAAVQTWIADRWRQSSTEVHTTRVNNVLAKIGGSGPRLAVMAHADEICFLVKSISDSGFLHIWPYYMDTRGYPPRWINPIGHPAAVMTSSGIVKGFFATPSGHVVPHIEPMPRVTWNDWFIDLGVSSRADAETLGVNIGDHVIWNPKTTRLNDHRIVGKAMDDRAALAIATLAGERLAGRRDLAYEVWLVSTVQEENGLIGAASVYDDLQIDLCLNLDVGLTGDTPGVDPRDFPSKLGAGPVVVYMDGTAHYSRRISDGLVAVGEQNGIPIQRAVFQQYGSDAAALIKRGVDSALIAYPTRYTHSPIETVDERDIDHCVDLIVAFATTPMA
jgi:putative aminopeptidase FrvX